MKCKGKHLVSLVLGIFLAAFSLPVSAADVDAELLDTVCGEVAAYLCQQVPQPQVGSTGGEWTVLGLSRSGFPVPEGYFDDYYQAAEEYVRECGGQLHSRKYTEYSRVVLALTAIGRNPANVGGYNLLTPLGDYDKTIWQGINGPIWALIALDSGGYDIPDNPDAQTQATRDMYIQRILDCQLSDGGWSLLGGSGELKEESSDPDITGMALQALSNYQDRPEVAQAIERALECMSQRQQADGGYESWGMANLESCVQMLVALCELGIPYNDARFVKNGTTMLDNLLTYYEAGAGFSHTSDGSTDLKATEQGFYGLVAVRRQLEGKSSLYQMDDVQMASDQMEQQPADSPVQSDIQVPSLTEPGKSFPDIVSHSDRTAIEALAGRGIITGMPDGMFAPDNTMTRAEFAAVVVRALGLPAKPGGNFADVPADAWYSEVVGTAFAYGIVTGVSDTAFSPDGTITREQAAVMVSRAAKLCGMDTDMELAAARNVLAGFMDYVTVSDWAFVPLAFCYDEQLLPGDSMEILPKQPITRAEIAHMLYRMLSEAALL